MNQTTRISPNLVSTIIPVHNRPEMLRAAVASVLAQTYRPIEIVIVDDGSTDSTPLVGLNLVEAHPQVVRFTRQENNGPGPARERGRSVASGQFIQYLDSDDRLLPNKFTDQVAALAARPDCGIAYGLTRLVDPAGKVLAAPFKWTAREIPELFPGLLVDRWWCTHTPLYRRDVTDRIGPWCDMRWSQDWEYDARAAAMNVQLISCGTYVSEHVHHAGQRQTSGAAWTTDPVRLRNRVALLTALWQNAQQAGVAEDVPERQHFARWSFSIARQCAAQGMKHETDACLAFAEAAAGSGPGRKGIGPFRAVASAVGVRTAGRLFRTAERLKQGGGAATMDQSFSTPSAKTRERGQKY